MPRKPGILIKPSTSNEDEHPSLALELQQEQDLALSALALLPFNIALGQPDKRALRLTCQRIRRAIDQSLTELHLKISAAANIQESFCGSDIFQGLRSFTSTWDVVSHDSVPPHQMFQTVLSLVAASPSLEKLHLRWPATAPGIMGLLDTLGVHQRPKLRELSIPVLPGFTVAFPPALTPNLSSLELTGAASVADLAELAAAPFSRSLTHLALPCRTELELAPEEDEESENDEKRGVDIVHSRALRNLAITMFPMLERLTLEGPRDLEFMEADMQCWKWLTRLELRSVRSIELSPLFQRRRPNLRSFTLSGRSMEASELQQLISEGLFSLPGLHELIFEGLSCPDGWSWLCEMDLPTLQRFELRDCYFATDDVGFIAVAISKLPQLTALWLGPSVFYDIEEEGFNAYEALQLMLTVPEIRALTELGFCGAWIWEDYEDLELLLSQAHVLPHLEVLTLGGAMYVDRYWIEALLDAGDNGAWPALKELVVGRVMDETKESFPEMLEDRWPGIEFKALKAD